MVNLYFFKLNGCGHCETMKQLLYNSTITSIPNLSIIEVEHNDKNKLSSSIQKQLNTDNINAYPDLKIINTKTGSASTYDGDRTVESIKTWIQTNSSTSSPKTRRRRLRSHKHHRGGSKGKSRRHRHRRRYR